MTSSECNRDIFTSRSTIEALRVPKRSEELRFHHPTILSSKLLEKTNCWVFFFLNQRVRICAAQYTNLGTLRMRSSRVNQMSLPWRDLFHHNFDTIPRTALILGPLQTLCSYPHFDRVRHVIAPRCDSQLSRFLIRTRSRQFPIQVRSICAMRAMLTGPGQARKVFATRVQIA